MEPALGLLARGGLLPEEALWVGPVSAGIPEPAQQLADRWQRWARIAEQGWSAAGWLTAGAADPDRRALASFRPPKPARPYLWAPLGHFLLRPERLPQALREATEEDVLETLGSLGCKVGWPIFCDPQLRMEAGGALVYYREPTPRREPMWISGLRCLFSES